MRILDQDRDRATSRITILLRPSEATELHGALEALLKDQQSARHEHVPSADHDKEITIALYAEEDMDSFDERSRRLIAEDR
jgi:hypothetical protein